MVNYEETVVSASKIKMTDRNVDTLELAEIWFASLAYPIEVRLEMIRTQYLTQINGLIKDDGRFKETDFTVAFASTDADFELDITYLFEPKYRFKAEADLANGVANGDIYVALTLCPGHIFEQESFNVRASALTDNIKNWLSRLRNELASIPIQREMEEQRRQILDIVKQLDDVPGEYFSKQEAEAVKAKLEDLESRLIKNLEETETNRKEAKEKIKIITDDMAVLKNDMQILSKKGWAKSLMTRTFEWAKDPTNAKLLKSGAEVVRKLLEPGDHSPH